MLAASISRTGYPSAAVHAYVRIMSSLRASANRQLRVSLHPVPERSYPMHSLQNLASSAAVQETARFAAVNAAGVSRLLFTSGAVLASGEALPY